ncbi:MAG: type II methionyl aminopeptidase [Candidatus Bathyarchaeota archaeon]|nr:MAG: type II methionyl aminopeptidase [Candidatus Bathyarchaeota archaeon]
MSLRNEVFEKYEIAGKIAREVREEVGQLVHPGTSVIGICEKTEALIRQKGARPAFPCNVSINHVAAHYTSPPNDRSIIPTKALVKVDIGVHLDGYIADTAITVCSDPEYENLVHASKEALEVAVDTIVADISTAKLGRAIQKKIKSFGCKPVSNLTGHQIGRYLIHTGKSIPNVSHIVGSKIREGDIIAVEPFVTLDNAAGKVREGDISTIFRFVKRRSVKKASAMQLLRYIEENFKTLPFSERWLGSFPEKERRADFRDLLRSKCLMAYPIFVEASGKPVSQAEHTVLVTKEGCLVLT